MSRTRTGTETIQAKNTIKLLTTIGFMKKFHANITNVGNESIIPALYNAQTIYIKKTLGSTLYKSLFAELDAVSYNPNSLPDGTITGTPPINLGDTINYKELYDEIQQPLIRRAYVMVIHDLSFHVSKAGVTIGSTEYSSSAGFTGVEKAISAATAIAQSYTETLQEYISETFKNNSSVSEEAVDVGGASIFIYTAKKPWSHKGCSNEWDF